MLAQLVEQPPCKRQVVGAEPTHGSIFCFSLAVMARATYNENVRFYIIKALVVFVISDKQSRRTL